MRHKSPHDFIPQEAKLADTPPTATQRPLLITIGAVLVTVIVIAGIVLWPATSDCMNGGGTFGSCVQQALADRGLAPQPVPSGPAEPEAVAEPEARPVAEPEIVTASPMIDARVEADGSTILAGTVDPNIDVHLFFNGIEVGQTTSDSVGDWIFIPNEPLPMGVIAITLGMGVEGEEIAQGAEALAVVIDGENEPTVVAAAPDELADLIAELMGTPPELVGEAETPMEMAAIDADAVPEVSEPETAMPDADLVAPEAEAVVEEPAASEEPAEQEVMAADEPVAPEEPAEEAAAPEPETVQDEPMQIAAVEPEQVTPEAPVTAVPPAISVEPTIDAVEVEPSGSFIAGGGEDGMTIRLYVDDEFVGESAIEGGRWLVETDQALSAPSQRIRAEMLAPNDIVTAEAEINFLIEQAESAVPDVEGTPIAAPAETPIVVAEVPAVVETEPTPEAQILILPSNSLSQMMLPLEAPTIAIAEAAPEVPIAEETLVEPEETSAPLVVAEAQPDAVLILPEDQLAPLVFPTEAPSVIEPEAADAEPNEPVVEVAEADEPAVEAEIEEPAVGVAVEPFTLPADQLPPIAFPTEAPLVATAPVAPAVEAETPIVEAIEDATEMAVAEAAPFLLPEDQLPPIALPTEAPLVAFAPAVEPVEAEEPAAEMVAEEAPAMEVAEADTPLDESDEIADEQTGLADAPTPAPAPLRLPADQLPVIEMPTEAPSIVIAEAAPADSPSVVTVEETPVEPEMPTLVATPVGDPDDGRFASGKVIIRRGDTLWTIARRVYGRGIEYRMIFEANREQIRNPHWIYPGQVFELPEDAPR